MRFCFNDLLTAVSFALDCVEHDLVGVTTNHSKRVACLCIWLGKQLHFSDKELSDLAGCALLHDNALTEYVQAEYLHKGDKDTDPEGLLGMHCSFGERNIKTFPFFGDVTNAVLYHHENVDGTGPFRKKEDGVSVAARLIHLADHIDAAFDLDEMTEEKYERIVRYIKEQRGILFTGLEAGIFVDNVDSRQLLYLNGERIDSLLQENLPHFTEEYPPDQIKAVASLFARIIDYKSTFTSSHSMGIAEKAYQVGNFYGWEEEEKAKFFLAGALHDIGKLAVDTQILEKPGKLTDEEYIQIKRHALISYQIISGIDGFGEIASWAALHHEKLNGKGYPFGYTAEMLGFHERLMACLDIYQALVENRPYKPGMRHSDVMNILFRMADNGELDRGILADIDSVFA